MTDHHDDDAHFAAVPVPAEVLAGMVRHADLHAMDRQQRQLRLDRFLDGLDVDGLLALRDLLNHDTDSSMNNYFDGQIRTLLRRIHHVDPRTGEPEIPAVPAVRWAAGAPVSGRIVECPNQTAAERQALEMGGNVLHWGPGDEGWRVA